MNTADSFNNSNLSIPVEKNVNIVSRGDIRGDELLLLLHGFGQSAAQIMKLLGKYLPEALPVLSLDGPHHVVTLREDSMRHGLAWYFFDREKDLYLTKISEAEEHVLSTLTALECKPKKLTIVGYSQGGYLAPYLGRRLPATVKVVGLNSRYRVEDFSEWPLSFTADAIHGERDMVVETDKSEDCHQRLVAAGSKGAFHIVERSGHKIDRALGKALRSNLEASV